MLLSDIFEMDFKKLIKNRVELKAKIIVKLIQLAQFTKMLLI